MSKIQVVIVGQIKVPKFWTNEMAVQRILERKESIKDEIEADYPDMEKVIVHMTVVD